MTKIADRVLFLHAFYNFERIYVDTTGIGAGVTDMLKRKVGHIVEEVIFTNTSKIEMFYNLKLLLQQKKLLLPDYITNSDKNVKKLFYQFLTIRQDVNEETNRIRIFHESNAHDDLVCALALACLHFKNRKKKSVFHLSGGYK